MKLKLNKKNVIIISIAVVLLLAGIGLLITKFFSNDKDFDDVNITDKEDKKDKENVIPDVQIVDVNSKARPYAVMINNL